MFPQTDTKGVEGYLAITLCFTICGLVASSFALLVCALPIGYCIYKVLMHILSSNILYIVGNLCGDPPCPNNSCYSIDCTLKIIAAHTNNLA